MKRRISFILVGAAVAAPMASDAWAACPAPVVVAPALPAGSVSYSLPTGAEAVSINGVQYYVAHGVYYRPYFGSNGVYYQVVGNPRVADRGRETSAL